MIRCITLLILVALPLYANVTILESTPGKVTYKISVDSLESYSVDGELYLKSGSVSSQLHTEDEITLPAEQVTITHSVNRPISVSLSYDKKATLQLSQPLSQSAQGLLVPRRTMHATKTGKTKRIPFTTLFVTPVKKVSSKSVTYYKEITVTVTYDIGVQSSLVPQGDFYQAFSKILLNPEMIPYTITALPRRSRISSTVNIPHGVPALHFSIHDSVTSKSKAETDLTQTNRLYRIRPSDVSPLSSGDIRFEDLRLQAAARHNFSKEPPTVATLPEVLVDVPVIIHDYNDDSLFNGSDEILFYGEKLPLWQLDTVSGTNSWQFHFNYFDFYRHYWITLDGGLTEMSSPSLPTSSSDTVTSGLILARHKESNSKTYNIHGIHIEHGDRRWVWRTFVGDATTFSDPITHTEIDTNSTTLIRLNAHFLGDIAPTGNVSRTYVDGVSGAITSGNYNTRWYDFDIASQESVDFHIESLRTDYIDFDSYDLQFRQNLTMSGRSFLSFYSDTLPSANVSYDTSIVGLDTTISVTSRTYETQSYALQNLPSEKNYLFRVNPYHESITLIDSIEGETSYTIHDTLGMGFIYHIASESSILDIPTPQSYRYTNVVNEMYQILDPRSTGAENVVDYLIITPQEFISNALLLAQHKRETGQFEHPKIVAVEDIFRQFSGGLREPSAIRDMLVFAEENWPVHNGDGLPEYAVFFGDGHYDYKGILTATPNLLPPYLEPIRNSYIVCGVKQDFWGTLSSSGIVSVISGRIPINSSTEAARYLTKLIATEDSTTHDLSFWRNKALLASDDDLKTDNGIYTITGETSHTVDSDAMGYKILEVSPATNLENLPLYEYPLTDNNLKPQAKSAFIAKINAGVSFVNYYGHGSPTLIADENLFASGDIGQLSNTNRYFIFSAFSCTVGLFDFANKKGMCESLLLQSDTKGAVATVASTRTAYVSTNQLMGSEFGKYLFTSTDTIIDSVSDDTTVVPISYSIGQALTIAKANVTDSLKSTYAQLGDPSYSLLRNRKEITLSLHRTEDGPSLEESAGVDTLQRLQTIYVKGHIQGANPTDRHTLRLELQNPERTDAKRKDGYQDVAARTYRLAGTITTSKEVEIVGESFSIPLFIPPNVVDTTAGSLVRAYTWEAGTNSCATGIVDTGFVFLGYDYSDIDSTDKVGPSITLRKLATDANGAIIDTLSAPVVESSIEIDGFDSKNNATYFDIHLADPSGIDYFGTQPGEGVRLAIEGIMPLTRIDADDITLIDDNYRTVRVRLQLDEADVPAAGEYEMTISARDILQNESVAKYTLKITSTKDEQYTIGNLFCYPTPVRMGQSTQFYFNVPNSGVQDITLKIFTVQGKLVKSIRNISPGHTWDLRDERGTQLTPNVYLYRLYVKRTKRNSSGFGTMSSDDTEIIRSPIKKIMIHPRN